MSVTTSTVSAAMRSLIANNLHFSAGEEGVCQVVSLLLSGGSFHLATDLPEVSHYEREFRLPHGRADFVVFHIDGSLTVIEVKRWDGTGACIRQAIGQVTSYAVQLGYAQVARSIRRMVCADVPGLGTQLQDDICTAAGVIWCPLGKVDEHQSALIKQCEGLYGKQE